MADAKFVEFLKCLETSEARKRRLRTLLRIRQNVEWPRDSDNILALREGGYLVQIHECIASKHKYIMDVALSILGNCTMDPNTVREVVRLIGNRKLVKTLDQIMIDHEGDEAVFGRLFRIIGNMSSRTHHRYLGFSFAILEYKPKIIARLVGFIRSTLSESSTAANTTIALAVRALREMGSDDRVMDTLIRRFELLTLVGRLLIKYGDAWSENDRKGEDVLKSIIKLLFEFSPYFIPLYVLKLKETADGNSLASLVKVLPIAPETIVRLVMNILPHAREQSDVPIPGLFEGLCENLNKYPNEEEGRKTGWHNYIRCLCTLFHDPMNRANEKAVLAIPTLVRTLSLLKGSSTISLSCCILIVNTLYRCNYHDSLMLEQVKHDIVDVLVGKIKALVGEIHPLNLQHNRQPIKDILMNDCRRPFRNTKVMHQLLRKIESDLDKRPWEGAEPRRGTPIPPLYLSEDEEQMKDEKMKHEKMKPNFDVKPPFYPSSIVLPSFHCAAQSDDSDTDDYSPVCSDGEDRKRPVYTSILRKPRKMSRLSNLHTQLMDSPEEEEIDDDMEEEEKERERILAGTLPPCFLSSSKSELMSAIVKHLKNLAELRPTVPHFSKVETLQALIKCAQFYSFYGSVTMDSIFQTLTAVVSNSEHLVPIMITDFIMTLERLRTPIHQDRCYVCQNFRYLGKHLLLKLRAEAESGIGRGEIAHRLLRLSVPLKQKLVLTIPYVIRSKSILVKLMKNCGGLGILMRLLKDDSEHQEASVKTLCVMASFQLNITNPKDVSSDCREVSVVRFHIDLDKYVEPAEVVAFRLDDGSVLKANRSILCKQSDFFAGLLNGSFKESSEDEVALHDVAAKSLKCLMHLMECDIKKTELKEFDVDLGTHLDLIALCDKFLMSDYCIYLSNSVEKFRLNSDTVPMIYQWSLESRTNFLRVECVAYALVGEIDKEERIKMFKELLAIGWQDELIEDIQDLMLRYMVMSGDGEKFLRRKRVKKRKVEVPPKKRRRRPPSPVRLTPNCNTM